MTPIRILLADDHIMVREGTRKILEREADLKVVAEAGDGRETTILAPHHRQEGSASGGAMVATIRATVGGCPQ